MQRRNFLKGLAGSVFGAALPVSGSWAQDRYAKYRGQKLTVSIPQQPHYDAMVKLLPDFTRETGIQVDIDRQPMQRMKFRQLQEMAKPQGDLDLICYVVMWKTEYVKKKLIRELAPFLANPALADPSYDLKDIVPRYLENLGLVGGPKGYLPGPGAKLYGLPYGAETSILAYRRDIFEKHKLQAPRTYDELHKLLPILKDREGIGALTSRGQQGHQCVHAWLLHLNPLGGKVFDARWRPVFNNEAGVKALALLKDIVDTGPAGIPEFGQFEMVNSFLQGNAAMYLDATSIFGAVQNPAASTIGGKVSYAIHPKGTRLASQSGGFGLAIPANARNPEAAFLLMQWLTSKAQDKAVSRLGGSPTRLSTIADADMVRQFPEYITLREQLKYADPDWRPIIAEWDDINVKLLGVAISEALKGRKTPQQALDDAVPKVAELMKSGGYLKT
ncbi:MAG: extracellular solute-binding protein [Sulfurisoma sp.]|nr:extracellular solute-binding protein [Sulfurisoma sp.]